MGVLSRGEALKKAQDYKLDLVLISQKAAPPVAKIVDLKRFLYQKQQLEKEARRKAKKQELKQLRFKPTIGGHDLETRIRRAKDFLGNGDKVKFIIQFFGRQITHKEIGEEKLDQVLKALEDVAEVEKEPWFEGKRLMCIVKPR